MTQIRTILLLFMVLTAIPALAAADSESASAQVGVENVQLTPGVLMYGDYGTVTIKVTNTGDESVAIDAARLFTNDLSVANENTYDSVGSIGAGNSMTFSFTLRADAADGIYYPVFYLDFRDAGSMKYPIPVTIESNELSVGVSDAPDSCSPGKSEDITFIVGNPRENMVTGVEVSVSGDGIDTARTSHFVGDLAPGESKSVVFEITPSYETELAFTTEYKNGINTHTTVLTVPLEMGEDRLGAELVLNSVEAESSGTGWTLSGDITNAGLTDARSVVVTVGSPAEACDPNPVYVIGTLEPDDFSSFEVTFTMEGGTGSSVPVIVGYKDDDGNRYEETFSFAMGKQQALTEGGDAAASQGDSPVREKPAGGGMMSFGGGMNRLPITEIIIVIVAGIGLAVAWRKGWLTIARGKIQAYAKKRSK